jgi:hypothetical protein
MESEINKLFTVKIRIKPDVTLAFIRYDMGLTNLNKK